MSAAVLAPIFAEHAAAVDGFVAAHGADLERLAARVADSLSAGGKLLVCGNGGSASDALHIAAEFVGRFEGERAGLAAIALSADSAALTAIVNDYGFERVFARQVEALGRTNDVLIGLSTSGASANVLAALAAARALGLATALFTGARGRERTAHADQVLSVPSVSTARVQEVHILALHALVALVEHRLGSGRA